MRDHSEPRDLPPTSFCSRTDSKPMWQLSAQSSSSGSTVLVTGTSSAMTLYHSQNDSGSSLSSREDLSKSEVPHAKESSDTIDPVSVTGANIDQAFARMSVSCLRTAFSSLFHWLQCQRSFSKGNCTRLPNTMNLQIAGWLHSRGGRRLSICWHLPSRTSRILKMDFQRSLGVTVSISTTRHTVEVKIPVRPLASLRQTFCKLWTKVLHCDTSHTFHAVVFRLLY